MSNLMQRIEVNLETGEQSIVDFTQTEIDEIIANAPPKFPDWETLYNRLLAGDLKPIFEDVKSVAKTNLAINVDYTNIIEAFKIKAEQALKDCLDELVADGYVISDEYKALWNNAVSESDFSDLVKL